MIRLNKVIRNLNISLDTVVAAISELGYDIDSKPSAIINNELYEILKKKFNYIAPLPSKIIFGKDIHVSSELINKVRIKKGIPDSVFKYFSLNEYNFESLENKYLFFSKPTDFNDPYDCSSDLISFINKNSKSKIRHKQKEKAFSENLNKIGICCFSRKNDSILMWSHYASNHKGFCVEYATNIDEEGVNPLDVLYMPEFTKAEYFEKAERAIFNLIYSKSNYWKYEEELRSLVSNCETEGDRKIGFRESDIISIYFGVNTEINTIERIQNIIKENYNSNVKFYKGKKSNKEFSIIWNEI